MDLEPPADLNMIRTQDGLWIRMDQPKHSVPWTYREGEATPRQLRFLADLEEHKAAVVLTPA